MDYLLDGYNLLFREVKNPRPLQRTRERILKALDEEIAEAGLHVTVIFDGSEKRAVGISSYKLEAVEVVFTSEGLSADDYILEMLSSAKNPKQKSVITGDRDLIRKAKRYGAETLDISDFFALILKKKKKKRAPSSALSFKDTDANIARLLAIFEENLKN
ncbi:MAG: NYN domain-containing protein [Chlamydiales bacterium]|nr:NYN domain-containing protein [Chlamydiales bacterium]